MSLLPSEPDTSAVEEADPRVIGVDSDEADDVLSALTSETARAILTELHREPAPPAELADRVDTSLQNAQYHLNNLEEAGAIEVIDEVYSEKGREMNVYAPADQPLVIFAGKEEQTSGLRAALSRLLGSLGLLALASAAVQAIYGEGLVDLGGSGGSGAAPDQQSGATGGGGAGADGGAGVAANASETTTTPPPEPSATPGDVVVRSSESDGDAFNVAQATGTPTQGAEAADGGGAGGATTQPEMTRAATEAPEATPTPAETATAEPMATGTPSSTPQPDMAETMTETVADGGQPVTEEATRTATETATPAATETVNTTVQTATDAAAAGGAEAVAGLPPGLVFFAGGATALLVGAAVVYVTR